MEEAEIERTLIEGVMDGIYKLHPDGRYSLTERGRVYAEHVIRTSPEAARIYCLLVLAKPGAGEPMSEVRWRDMVTRLWRVMSPKIHTDDAELQAALPSAPPEAAAEIMRMCVDDCDEFALELAGEILALSQAGGEA